MSKTIRCPIPLSQYLTDILEDESFLSAIKSRMIDCDSNAHKLYEAMIDNMADRGTGTITRVAIPFLLSSSGLSYNEFLTASRMLRHYKLVKTSFKYENNTYLPDVFNWIMPQLPQFERDDLRAYLAELAQWVGNDGINAKRSILADKFGKK